MANSLTRSAAVLTLLAVAGCSATGGQGASSGAAFTAHDRDVNGTRLHYRLGGNGSPVVLLHGFAQTGHMWAPLAVRLAEHHTVVIPDLRGAGDSAKPADG